MGTQEPAQEFVDAYRYQLATIAYAAGATHYHAQAHPQDDEERCVGVLVYYQPEWKDPDIKELRRPWADPVVKENIMVSYRIARVIF
jgi:hypothetical protein